MQPKVYDVEEYYHEQRYQWAKPRPENDTALAPPSLGAVGGYPGGDYPSCTGVEPLASHRPDEYNNSTGSNHHDAATGNVNAAGNGTCTAIREGPPAMAGFYMKVQRVGSLDV
ncbi:hypothetical protein [Rhizobium jaguaris]|uniref:hypothetical protein n=1 Tax=Rhizobium jaguaris TaxID=1312183 RepID=UPI0013C49A93|nr:hypothetical protein [Rhizobium jaguaris]